MSERDERLKKLATGPEVVKEPPKDPEVPVMPVRVNSPPPRPDDVRPAPPVKPIE